MKKGIRKSVYISNKDQWILSAISSVTQEAEKLGVFLSESEVIVQAVVEYLEKYRKCPKITVKKLRAPVYLATNKRSIRCPKSQEWLLERVEQLLVLKEAAGLRASFSRELITLAVAGLTSDINYGKICRKLLQGSYKKEII